MCTSFTVYNGRSIYAMNFDYWEVASRIRINDIGDISSFLFEINQGGTFLETAGMNTNGSFSNFQGNLSEKHVNVVPNENCITIADLYRNFLNSNQLVKDVDDIISKKTVLYPPIPPEFNKLHNMFADKNGNALILESACGKNDITRINDNNFLVMTNFPVGQFKNMNYKDVSGAGSDRYIKAYEYLSNIKTDFSVDNAFEILENTVQKEEKWETIISMVFVPDELTVYAAIRRDFNKIWKVDIKRKCIETFRGFENKMSMDIGSSGVDIANLAALS